MGSVQESIFLAASAYIWEGTSKKLLAASVGGLLLVPRSDWGNGLPSPPDGTKKAEGCGA